MAGTDPVTYDELGAWCTEKRHECERLREAHANNAALKIEGERREGMSEIRADIEELRSDVRALKEMLTSSAA